MAEDPGDWFDNTPVTESEYEHCEHAEQLARHVNKITSQLREHALVCEQRIIALERAIEMLIARMPGGEQSDLDPSDDPEWY